MPLRGAAIKQCVLASEYNLWEHFVSVHRQCIDAHAPSLTDGSAFFELHMGRFNEIKYFLPFAGESRDCTWLTIGIGGDDQVEREMAQLYPHCRIYGVEPMADQQAGFSNYGTVLPFAVGVERAEMQLRVRVNTSYMYQTIPVVPLNKAVRESMQTTRVDFVTLDIEGFEYTIMRALEASEALSDITICQLDVELHKPDPSAHVDGIITSAQQFDEFYRQFLRRTPFIPVAALHFLSHRKLTLVNGVDECVRRFGLDTVLR